MYTFSTLLCVKLPRTCPIEFASLHRGQFLSLADPCPSIRCSVSAGNSLVLKDTVPCFESFLLFSGGDAGTGEKSIAGFRKCVHLNAPPSLDVHRGVC
jgi:hypothetical protein